MAGSEPRAHFLKNSWIGSLTRSGPAGQPWSSSDACGGQPRPTLGPANPDALTALQQGAVLRRAVRRGLYEIVFGALGRVAVPCTVCYPQDRGGARTWEKVLSATGIRSVGVAS
ncbi:hypothetical protein GCM10022214_25540 [Actinomadura miaoliensis]|uniref:Uncharacterized protein n=1 Tax=Actinomadura miaoliensis TaxID=430685 RepID=A0ABP7VL24_9ACTN